MTQWDMILVENSHITHLVLPHNGSIISVVGKPDNKRIRPHNGINTTMGQIPQCGKPHTLHEPMKVRGEDNHAPTMPYTMAQWEWAMSGEYQTI